MQRIEPGNVEVFYTGKYIEVGTDSDVISVLYMLTKAIELVILKNYASNRAKKIMLKTVVKVLKHDIKEQIKNDR